MYINTNIININDIYKIYKRRLLITSYFFDKKNGNLFKNMMAKGINPSEVYNIDSLAAILGIQPSTVRRAVGSKKLKARKMFGRFYFLGRDVINSINEMGEPYNSPSDWTT